MHMDKREFTKLFRDNADAIYRFAYWRVSDAELAEDITSTVFTKAWEKRDSFDGKHAKAWLYMIARNTIIDGYRRHKDEPLGDTFEIAVDDETPSKLDLETDKATLVKALGSLSDELREIIQWRFIERASVRETAERTGQSEANVRVMQFRALKKLKAWYERRK